MPLNNFLPFSPTDTGTNLLSQSDYQLATDRTIGNQPGVASSKLVNKAIRQSAYVTSNFAQFLADQTGTDIVDDATPAKLLAQIKACVMPIAPTISNYLSGVGTHNPTYYFFIASGNATSGATYTNNSFIFTVVSTITAGFIIKMTGTGAPLVSGSHTKATGTGDSTLTFYSVRAPVYLKVRMVGGGGGSSGSGTTDGGGSGNGGDTTFGTSLLFAGGGPKGTYGDFPGSNGGTASLGTGPVGLAISGGSGGSYAANSTSPMQMMGACGGMSAFGGGGGNGTNGGEVAGAAGAANTGGGAGAPGGGASLGLTGNSGAAGGYVDAHIFAPYISYPYSVGAGGAAGLAGTSGAAGAVGGSGVILVEEHYQ